MTNLREPVWNENLKCYWYGLLVHAPCHVVLLIKPDNSVDMTGALRVALAVMPEANEVTAVAAAGGQVDVAYRLIGGDWKALNPPRGSVLREALALDVRALVDQNERAMMERDALIGQGVAIYQVGEVFDVDADGSPIPENEKARWFVSVLANSPLSATVRTIPFAATEDEAWRLAAHHYRRG
jgi:hypothetical protein